MSRRLEFIDAIQPHIESGRRLLAQAPTDPSWEEEVKVLRRRVQLLERWVSEAAVMKDDEWERRHPKPGTWRRRWADWKFRVGRYLKGQGARP